MSRPVIDEARKTTLLKTILSGFPVKQSADTANISYGTAKKYYISWKGDGNIPAGLKCRCQREFGHKGACVGKRTNSTEEHHSELLWGQMLATAQPKLIIYALRLARNQTQAEDLASATVVKCLDARTSFTPGTNLMGWLYTCLYNNYISTCRVGKRNQTLTGIEISHPEALAIPETVTDSILSNQIIAQIARQFPNTRDVCFMRWLDGRTYEEIATIKKIPVGTVKAILSRAKAKLRRLLGASAGEGRDMGQTEMEQD